MWSSIWQKLTGARLRPKVTPMDLQPLVDSPPPPATPQVTRDAYIHSALPIADELDEMFATHDRLVIFDIGSCEGEDSIRYAMKFPKAQIYAFEPVPGNMAIIRRQLVTYGADQVRPFALALSDERGTATFHVSSGAPEHLPNSEHWDYGNKSGSLLPPGAVKTHYPWLNFEQAVEVQTETLEAFCADHGIGLIDFIHMDVQGAELKVLRGAGAMLQRVRAIWMEIEKVALYEGQPLADEMQRFMEENGFVKKKDTVDSVTGDHFYVRKGDVG